MKPRELFTEIFLSMVPRAYMTPAEWAAENIVFPPTDPVPGPFDLAKSPYLREVLQAWELSPRQGLKVLTVVGPQQTGKTLAWLGGLLWSMDMDPGPSLIYYTSEETAKKINAYKMEPLLKEIPRFRELLSLPRSHSQQSYNLIDNQIFFGGVGSRIASFSAKRLVADELDDWLFAKGTDPLKDLEMRSRAFPESLLCAVCTPRGANSRIWSLFEESSEGYFTLRCQGCGELTLRSCDIVNLKFETDADGKLVPESVRLVCPACSTAHEEKQAADLVMQGEYVHEHPELIPTRPGFQWGALASLISPQLRWEQIARAQLLAGKSGRPADQIFFDNSMKGLPFRPRAKGGKAELALRRHALPTPEPKQLIWRFFAADTQDLKWYWIVRGVDEHLNSHLLAVGQARTMDELTAAYHADYAGGHPNMGIIDEGGHRARLVRQWAAGQTGVFTYKGNPRIQSEVNYKISDAVGKLLVARELYYRVQLLYTLYTALPEGENSWYVTHKLPREYIDQMSDYHPPTQGKARFEDFEEWISNGNDHYFDCEKMMLAFMDYFREVALPIALRKKIRVERVPKRGGVPPP